MTTLTDSYQELLRFAIAERDAFYEGATDPEGNLTDPEDQAELDRIDAMIDRAQAALSGAQQGEAEPVAWAVFADNGNIRIWGRDKPEGFPEAVPLYLSPTVKDCLTVRMAPLGYADPDCLSDYRAGHRLHIPVYRPDASAEWQAGIPVYLHAAPQPAQVPEGWSIRSIQDGDAAGFIIGSPRIDGVRTNTSVWADDEDPAHALLFAMLTAAPSGDHIGDANKMVTPSVPENEIKARVVSGARDMLRESGKQFRAIGDIGHAAMCENHADELDRLRTAGEEEEGV